MSQLKMTFEAASQRWYERRRKGATFIQAALLLMIAMLWAPEVTSPGESSFNITIVVAVALFAFVLMVPGFFGAPFSGKADRTLLTLIVTTTTTLAVLALLSASYAEEPFRVFRVVAGLFFGIATLYAVANLQPNWSRLKLLLNFHIWCAVVSSLFVTMCYFYAPLTALAFGEGDRTSGFFKHANQFGMALSLTAPILMAMLLSERISLLRVLQLVCLLLGLVFSGSKSNLIISFANIIVVLMLWIVRTRVARSFPILIPMTFIIPVLIGIAGFYVVGELNPRAQRLLTATAAGETIYSIQDRLDIYSTSIEEGWKSPFTGVGAGQYLGARRMPHSHNVLVDYFRTLGFPGLFLISALILLLLMHATRGLIGSNSLADDDLAKRIIVTGLSVSIVSYVLSNQLSDSFGPSTLPLCWLSVALLFMAQGCLLRRQCTNDEKPRRVGTLDRNPSFARMSTGSR